MSKKIMLSADFTEDVSRIAKIFSGARESGRGVV
jgi:hypothetical protein